MSLSIQAEQQCVSRLCMTRLGCGATTQSYVPSQSYVCQAGHMCGAVSESLDHGEEGRQAASGAHQRLVLGGQEHAGLHGHTAPKRYVYGSWTLQDPSSALQQAHGSHLSAYACGLVSD